MKLSFKNLPFCIVCNDFSKENLCQTCLWLLIGSECSTPLTKREGLSSNVIWDWHLNNQLLISRLIYGLKGGGFENLYSMFAAKLMEQAINTRPFSKDSNVVIVAAPAHSADVVDHAGQLANSLSGLSGWPKLNLLRRNTERKQKHSTLQDRAKIEFSLLNKESFEDLTIVFVDDVMATGSTAKSAKKALGPCKSFEFWGLVYRCSLIQRSPLDITHHAGG